MTEKSDYTLNSQSHYWSLTFEDKNIPWEPFSPGVEIFPLCKEKNGDMKAALLRNAPGAIVPEHIHQGYEFIMVLSGSERDAEGTYHAGDFVFNPPGSSHSLVSDEGNTVLIVWEAPIRFTG